MFDMHSGDNPLLALGKRLPLLRANPGRRKSLAELTLEAPISGTEQETDCLLPAHISPTVRVSGCPGTWCIAFLNSPNCLTLPKSALPSLSVTRWKQAQHTSESAQAPSMYLYGWMYVSVVSTQGQWAMRSTVNA